MPKTISKTVYTINELGQTAKEYAINTERENVEFDYSFVLDDCIEIAEMLGISIASDINGAAKIRFTGFSSQGDGASFAGSYKYKELAFKSVSEYAPQDLALHSIANRLTTLQQRANYTLECLIDTNNNRYAHNKTMVFSFVEDENDTLQKAAIRDKLSNVLREFADWIYSRLNDEYDYQTSDETITETLESNDIYFDVTGTLETV